MLKLIFSNHAVRPHNNNNYFKLTSGDKDIGG